MINDVFKVVNLEVGAVGSISDPVLEAQARQVLSPTSEEVLLSVPVLAQIDPAFLGNAMSTLEKTASLGRTGRIGPYCESARNDPAFLVVFAELAGSYGRFQRGTKPDDIWGSRCWLNYEIGKSEFVIRIKLDSLGSSDKLNDLCAAADYNLGTRGDTTSDPAWRFTHRLCQCVSSTKSRRSSPISWWLNTNSMISVRSSRAFVLGEWHKKTTRRLVTPRRR